MAARLENSGFVSGDSAPGLLAFSPINASNSGWIRLMFPGECQLA
jgi:hypothetical protein